MGMQINTNVSALNTYRNLTATQNSLGKSLEKLSSGLRINRASDDAAGLVISEGLKAQIGGLQVASRNAQDGISVVQTAEGALGQAQSVLQRLRDLAVQAGNDSNTQDARDAITKEATSLVAELERIGNSTHFNGRTLLNGGGTAGSELTFQVGASGDENSQIKVSLGGANLVQSATNLSTGAATGGTSWAIASDDLAAVTGQLVFQSSTTSTDGTSTNAVTVTLGSAPTSYAGLAESLNSNSEFAAKFTAVVDYETTGDKLPKGITIKALDGGTVSADADTQTKLGGAGTPATATTGISFDNATDAQTAINKIDAELKKVSTARADLGAVQNRFDYAISNISVAIENLSASKSRITDVDMASEMVNYTRAQILSQSGTAMLAQANSAPQLALQLLQG
ncbi:flagellin [Naasia sp. SYSU D00948]|uniref:flagellin N-terminal helical domain-containing protein n=1 Tax=Naasia sp. SYSU D00948 TaxID=2817379 RepID=UPI001B30EF49|nr:flagellin [Naasia sp. SYSU D00948]